MGSTGEIRNVETFAAGEYEGDEEGETWQYSDKDMQAIAKNFALLSAGPNPIHRVPIASTHEGQQAWGWVKDAKPKKDLLLTDWDEVDPRFKDAIRKGRFKKVSAEIKRDFTDRNGKVYPGPYLYRVAVLGADVPRVKGLADIPAQQFADKTPGRRFERKLKFASSDDGDQIMDRAAAIQILTDHGVDPAIITDQVPDEVIQAWAMSLQADSAEDDADVDRGQFGDDADDDMPPGVRLENADDDDQDDDRRRENADDWQRRGQNIQRQRQRQLPGGAGRDKPHPKRTVSIRQFADPILRAVKKAISREVSRGQKKIATAIEGRATEERINEVRMFCDRMAKEGRISVADNDEASHTSERSQLVLMARQPQTVHSFADPTDTTGAKKIQKTQLQLRQEKIAAQQPRMFSERVKVGANGATGGVEEDAFSKNLQARYKRENERRERLASRN